MYKKENHFKHSLKVHLVLAVECRNKLINKYIDFPLKTEFKQIKSILKVKDRTIHMLS